MVKKDKKDDEAPLMGKDAKENNDKSAVSDADRPFDCCCCYCCECCGCEEMRHQSRGE